jgi:hypothetical protein
LDPNDGTAVPFDDVQLVKTHMDLFANLKQVEDLLEKVKSKDIDKFEKTELMRQFQLLANRPDVAKAVGASRLLEAKALMVYYQLTRDLLHRVKSYKEIGVNPTTVKVLQVTLYLLGFGSKSHSVGKKAQKISDSVRDALEKFQRPHWPSIVKLMNLQGALGLNYLLTHFSAKYLAKLDPKLREKARRIFKELPESFTRQSPAVDTFYHWNEIILSSLERQAQRPSRKMSMRSSKSFAERAGSFSNE